MPGLPAVLEDSTPLLQRLHAFFEHERYSLGRRTTPAPPPRPRWGPGSVGHARRQPPPPAAGPSPYFQRLQRHARSMRQPATPAAPGPPPAAGTAEEILGWRRAVYAEGTWTRIQWPLQERGVEPRRSRAELRAWVLRELQVLLPSVDCTLILTLVLALFGTPGPHADAIRALDCFLGTRTAHFWHELRWVWGGLGTILLKGAGEWVAFWGEDFHYRCLQDKGAPQSSLRPMAVPCVQSSFGLAPVPASARSCVARRPNRCPGVRRRRGEWGKVCRSPSR